MNDAFHEGQRQLQDRFDTRRLADHSYAKLVRDAINPKQKAFIESADMFFLATADGQGRRTCSYKGGDPGFVRVSVREVFGNCPRYIHRYQLVERSAYVPRPDTPTPVPEWKKLPDMNQVLTQSDPARQAIP